MNLIYLFVCLKWKKVTLHLTFHVYFFVEQPQPDEVWKSLIVTKLSKEKCTYSS